MRHRPGYPAELLDVLASITGAGHGSVIADIGAGTGISTELLLRTGATVFAVEPNAPMRAAAVEALGADPRFHAIDASAEATTLPDGSVDVVAAGQAFHWFDPQAARREFLRILRPGGWVALFFNTRRTDATPFLTQYEALLRRFGTDYARVDHRNVGMPQLAAFFGGSFRTHRFPSAQRFDYASLEGRLLSSSYAPAPGHPQHGPMLRALRAVFDATSEDGYVRFLYDTELHVGQLGAIHSSMR